VSTYRPNKAAFDREVLCAPFMVAEMAARAERGKAAAEASSPDAAPIGVGFKYRWEASAGVRRIESRRAYGRVSNTDPDAVYIIFGTKDTPSHRDTIGRALDAMR